MQTDLRQFRTEILKESQAAFGERFGVDQSTVHRWETEGLPDRGAARHAVQKMIQEYQSEAAQ